MCSCVHLFICSCVHVFMCSSVHVFMCSCVHVFSFLVSFACLGVWGSIIVFEDGNRTNVCSLALYWLYFTKAGIRFVILTKALKQGLNPDSVLLWCGKVSWNNYLGGKKKKKLFSGFILHKIKHINRSQINKYLRSLILMKCSTFWIFLVEILVFHSFGANFELLS